MFKVFLCPSFSHGDEDYRDYDDCGHANGHVSSHLNGVHCHVRVWRHQVQTRTLRSYWAIFAILEMIITFLVPIATNPDPKWS